MAGPQGPTGPAGPTITPVQAEQSANAQATGPNWSDIPGALVTVTSTGRPVLLLATGTFQIIGNGYDANGFGTCAIRFVVDGTPTGDATFGDQRTACYVTEFCAMAAQRLITPTAGDHSIQVQLSAPTFLTTVCRATNVRLVAVPY